MELSRFSDDKNLMVHFYTEIYHDGSNQRQGSNSLRLRTADASMLDADEQLSSLYLHNSKKYALVWIQLGGCVGS